MADPRRGNRRGTRPTYRTLVRAALAVASCLLLTQLPFPNRLVAEGQESANKRLVDNFEGTGLYNALGNRSGAFSDPKNLGYCYIFYTIKSDQVLGGRGNSLYIKWDTATTGAWGGYWTDLNHLNLKEYNFLTFYLKGLQGGEQFKIGLRGQRESGQETKLLIGEVLAGGVKTEWQKVSIPLRLFQEIRNWDDVNILSFSFESAAGSRSGAVLIDEIAFEK